MIEARRPLVENIFGQMIVIEFINNITVFLNNVSRNPKY